LPDKLSQVVCMNPNNFAAACSLLQPPESEPEALPNRIEIALLVGFVFVHSVLKWLHHPFSKNVMLLHAATSSHDFLHAAMLGSNPGD